MSRSGFGKRRLRTYLGTPKVSVTVEQLDTWITNGIRLITRNDLVPGPVAVCEEPWDRVFVAELPAPYSRIQRGKVHAVSIEHIVALSGPSKARTRTWQSRFTNLGVASLPFIFKGHLLTHARAPITKHASGPGEGETGTVGTGHDVVAGAWFGAFWVGSLVTGSDASNPLPLAFVEPSSVRDFLASANPDAMSPGAAIRHLLRAIGQDPEFTPIDAGLVADVAAQVMSHGINAAFDANTFEEPSWRRQFENPSACVTVRIGMSLSTMFDTGSPHAEKLKGWQDALRSQVLPTILAGSGCPRRFIPDHPAFEDFVYALATVGEWLVQPDRPFVEKLIKIRQLDADKRLDPRQALFAGAIYGAIMGYPRTNRAVHDIDHRKHLASLAMATLEHSDKAYSVGARLTPQVSSLVGGRRIANGAQAAGPARKLPRHAPLPNGITHSRSRLFKP